MTRGARGLSLGLALAASLVPGVGAAPRGEPSRVAAGALPPEVEPVELDPEAGPVLPFARPLEALPGEAPSELRAEIRGLLAERRAAGTRPAALLGWLAAGEGLTVADERVVAAKGRARLELVLARAPVGRPWSLWELPEEPGLVELAVTVLGGPAVPPARWLFLGPFDGEGHWYPLPEALVDPGANAPAPGDMELAPGRALPLAFMATSGASLAVSAGLGPRPTAGFGLRDDTPGWTVVAEGALPRGEAKPRREVLRSETALRREWRRVHEDFVPVPPLPVLDPARETMVALYAGERRGNARLAIRTTAREADGRVRIRVGIDRGPPEAPEDRPASHPFLFIRVPVPASRPLEVEWE